MLNSNISNESAQGFGEWLRESNYAFIYKTMAGIFNTVEPWIDEKIINEMLKDVTEIDRNYNELEFRNIEAILSGNAGQDFDVIRNRNFFFGC